MLYATTRNNTDAFTAQWVLTGRRGEDGGLFVPYRIPAFSQEEIQALGQRSFNSNVADCLNLLFGSHLTSYDVDLTIGRYSVRLQQLGQKILVAECWHNTDWHFERMAKDLAGLVLADKNSAPDLQGWTLTGIRIGVLFGIFGELIRHGIAGQDQKIDISVVSGDFSAPMAAWYGRYMGLPIGNIICCCNENSNLWDFICHGQLRTDTVARKTMVPEGDITVPEGLERLIGVYGGPEEVLRYVEAVHRGASYYVEDSLLKRLRRGLYVTVSSDRRICDTISSTYGTHRYVLGPAGALAYAGLQDYRARTGAMHPALMLTEKSPVLDAPAVADAMGMDRDRLTALLHR